MKIFCFSLLLVLVPGLLPGQSYATNSAGYGEEIPSAGCLACAGTDWNNLDHISIADDSVATTGLNPFGNCFMSTCFYCRSLYAHNFNFKIPVDATIDSIFVDIRRTAYIENSIRDTIVQLVKSGSPTGSNLASTVIWPKSLQYESYGHNDPLWGTTLRPVDLNDTTSGVALKIENISAKEAEAGVDHIQMTIYFSTSTGIFSVNSSPADVEWINAPDEVAVNIYTPLPVPCSSKIYTLSGQEISSTAYGRSLIGQNHFNCSIENLPGGIYIWKILVGSDVYSRKILAGK